MLAQLKVHISTSEETKMLATRPRSYLLLLLQKLLVGKYDLAVFWGFCFSIYPCMRGRAYKQVLKVVNACSTHTQNMKL